MSELIVICDSCDQCGFELLGSANFCGNCGAPATFGAQLDVINSPQHIPAVSPQVVIFPPARVSLVDEALNNRAIVVAILLCAGPIGLPALWFSRRFSKRAKIVTTTVYFLVTAVLPLVATWYFLDVSLRPLVNIFNG